MGLPNLGFRSKAIIENDSFDFSKIRVIRFFDYSKNQKNRVVLSLDCSKIQKSVLSFGYKMSKAQLQSTWLHSGVPQITTAGEL